MTTHKEHNKIMLANISGVDRPGVTAQLMEVLARHNALILDIGQADIHSHLNLGILFQTSDRNSGDLLKDLLFKSYELNVKIRFSPISDEDYSSWVSLQGKNRYIITIVARQITAQMIQAIASLSATQGLNIDSIKRLTGRIPLQETERRPLASVEFSMRGTPSDTEALQKSFMDISGKLNVDISFQRESMFRRMRRLICFDMDSTLIQTEVIDELAIRAGVGDEVKAITESAMRGEIDFTESFRRRVSLLKGLDVSVMQDIAENLPMTEGVGRLLRTLKMVGFKIAILSGGFTFFGNYLKNKYPIDYIYANELEVKDGKLTGRYLGEVVDGRRKAELLRLIAQVENVDLMQTVAVGDGANDLPMLSSAGLGIAFHAKPKVKESASQAISTVGLDGILYFLGYKDSHIDENKLGIDIHSGEVSGMWGR
ncbi:phosphoserine phosphatase SerB [Porphyromonas crevioricanis]|uniref:Phosphoserine phosphatase n=2 Tax=Porphyromonas crevioricanis TaxID=393921 RepID=A0A2X4ST43_9PORP|nr:phosphoserine phosphatase SerB [Porphyromonas crevioricanis]GAD05373.1 phosphoserine phosphatase [Porphyromonas crevioricanis JCM 15906]GAD08295.1 phosphoserine phosphatase [Porphyromonas crevioricanis JCM 13913]SJZ85563.1 phosphoserine phosphatase [Porphyromonas crevioricanis]SQH73001.1 Phosphoserine phosphatase [Porphyromonas crevioricanis]